MNYYNEFDPNAAAWLRQLIADKQIPDGVVDDRSITEITPHDLKGFTQCHFFAGVGGWPLALNLAGVPEDRPLWTASLPCQPFSTAGKQDGTADERHLWPVFERLVRECRPPTILGEQVSSKLARDDWFPGVCMDLEALGYAVFGADLCAPCAGEIGEGRIVRGDQDSWERIVVGAPHIRQRLYWVANAGRQPYERRGVAGVVSSASENPEGETRERQRCGDADSDCGTTGGVADAPSRGFGVDGGAPGGSRHVDECSEVGGWKTVSFAADCLGGDDDEPGDECSICGLTYAEDCECPGPTQDGYEYVERDGTLYARWMGDTSLTGPQGHSGDERDGGEPRRQHPQQARPARAASWTHSIAIPCRDGKARRVEPSIQPLVNGVPRGVVPSGDPGDPSYANATGEARVMRLKGYGNAIVPPLAALFIRTAFEAIDETPP